MDKVVNVHTGEANLETRPDSKEKLRIPGRQLALECRKEYAGTNWKVEKVIVTGEVPDKEIFLASGRLFLDTTPRNLSRDGIVGCEGLALLRGIRVVWDR